MSDDALAALLLAYKYRNEETTFTVGPDQRHEAVWLRARGVVVLPPAVAEVLRTGEPSEAMARAFVRELNKAEFEDDSAFGWRVYVPYLRAALAVLRESWGGDVHPDQERPS